jgi:hypothetical protein
MSLDLLLFDISAHGSAHTNYLLGQHFLFKGFYQLNQ